MTASPSAVIYIRAAAGDHAAAAAQEAACRDVADRLALHVVDVVVDQGSSRASRRPAFEQVLARVDDGITVLTWSSDRVSRNVSELSSLLSRMDAAGGRLITADGFDSARNPLASRMLGTVAASAVRS